MDNHDVAFDEILDHVGSHGTFQKHFNLIFNIGAVLFASMTYMNLFLAVNAPSHHCHVPGMDEFNITDLQQWKNITLPKKENNRNEISYDSCNMYNLTKFMYGVPYESINFTENDIVACQFGYEYDQRYYDRTPVTEHDWVCDKTHLETNVFVIIRVGETIGTLLFGRLGDTYGRRFVFYTSTLTIVIGRLISIFTSSVYFLFALGTFLASLSSASIFQSALIIALETAKDEYRAEISMKQNIAWTAGMVILSLTFWASRDWFWSLLLTTLPCLVFIILPKYLIESPRWLASRGEYRRAAQELNKIARLNGRKNVNLNEDKLQHKLGHHKNQQHYGIGALFYNFQIGKNTIIMTFMKGICDLAYFTIILNSSRMDGNPFLNFLWQSVIELPAFIIGQKLSDRIGRRFTNVVAFVCATLFSIPIIFTVRNADYEHYSTTLATLIKLCISITFFSVNLQSLEIYPTCLRHTGIAFSIVAANVLGVLGPYIVKFGQEHDLRFPFFIIGAFTTVGIVAGLFLPETLYQKLPETIEDAAIFGTDQKFWSLPKKHKHLTPVIAEEAKLNDSENL